jgi:hypothetical protein
LPNVVKVIIAPEGKKADKNAKLWLQAYENGIWVAKEPDGITATTGCQTYEYIYKSDVPVQIRFVLAGGSATRLYWLYVEGLNGGSGTWTTSTSGLPMPDESTVTLFDDKADRIAFETLVGISSYGWDPKNKGIYINWHRQFTNRINNDSGGAFDPRDSVTRHDSQNDIRALQHYYWFKSLHNNTPYFDRAIARLLPTVKSKFTHPSSIKGLMYFVLQRLKQFTDNPSDVKFWDDAIQYWANNVYQTIDPTEGVFYETNMGNCDCGSSTIYLDKAYRVDQQVESGAALVHAGTIYNKPEWVSAGYKQVLTAYNHAFVENYGLFGRIYLMGNSGYKKNNDGSKTNYDYSAYSNKVWDGQTKMGEVSEEIDALLRSADVATDPVIKAKFFEIASKMMDALRTQPIHDKTRGGYYMCMYVANDVDGNKSGTISSSQKEMRQASLLGTFNIANRIIPGNNWQNLEKEMYWLLVNSFSESPKGMYLPNVEVNPTETYNDYRKTLAGYSYRLASDWNIYPGKVAENWVSNESNSLALLGLLEFIQAKYTLGYDDDFISGISTINATNNQISFIDNKIKSTELMKAISIYDLTGNLVSEFHKLSDYYEISSLHKGFYIAQIQFNTGKTLNFKFTK